VWAGDGGEGAKYWLRVLTELKNRGVADVLIMVCDGLTGPPEAIAEVWGENDHPDVCGSPAAQLVPVRQPG